MDDSGGHVITWHSNLQDGSGYGIYGQRYSATGAAQGSEFRVNTFTTSDQLFGQAAMDADGDFVVAWQSDQQDGSGTGVYARQFRTNPPIPDIADSVPDPRQLLRGFAVPHAGPFSSRAITDDESRYLAELCTM
jgi:hypothetical protein